jgi:transcription termination factor Rho
MDEVIYEEFKGTGNMELILAELYRKVEYFQLLIFIDQEHGKKSY